MMSTQYMTLNIPEPLYQHLKRRADQANRSVEEETLEVLVASSMLPADLTQAIESLHFLDDSALWNAARSRLPATMSSEMEGLHFKQQREQLNDSEKLRLVDLTNQYERQLLVRAQAAALLKQRGHDLGSLLSS